MPSPSDAEVAAFADDAHGPPLLDALRLVPPSTGTPLPGTRVPGCRFPRRPHCLAAASGHSLHREQSHLSEVNS
ncbi:Protocadherin Fat 3 [Manis pentadactyla]|nr:Protocadherin Fat 3 [Manis pentadactyla]